MGFFTALGTGVATGVLNEQNRNRDERAEMMKAAMDRLNATIDRRERELEERAKVEQQANMIARSRGLPPAAVRAALQAGRNPDDILSGQESVRPSGGPAPVAGPLTGATPVSAPAPTPGGTSTLTRNGQPITPPANMYGRNAGRVADYEAALAGGPDALADRSSRLASASGLPEVPGGYSRPLGSTEGVAGAGVNLPPASGVIPRAPAAAAPAPAPAAPAAAPQQFPEGDYADPVLAQHRASLSQPAPGPVARGVMDMLFGRNDPSRISAEAERRVGGMRGMSPEAIHATRQPLARDQMPEGYGISRLPYDQSRLLSDPDHFDTPADGQAAGLPRGVLTGGEKLRIQNDGRLAAAEARAAAAAARPHTVPASMYAAGREALASALGSSGRNSPLQAVPDPARPGSFRLMPSMASNRPEYRTHLAKISEMNARTDDLIERGSNPGRAAQQAAQEAGYLAAPEPERPAGGGAARPTTEPPARRDTGQLRTFRTPQEAQASGLPRGTPFLDANGVRRMMP